MMGWKLIAAALSAPLLATVVPPPAEGQPPEEMVTITIKADGEVTIARPMVPPPTPPGPPAEIYINVTSSGIEIPNGGATVNKRTKNLDQNSVIHWIVNNQTTTTAQVFVANFKWKGKDPGKADECIAPDTGGKDTHFRDPLQMVTQDHGVTVQPGGPPKKIVARVRATDAYTGCYEYLVFLNGQEQSDPELEFDSDDGQPPPGP